MKLTQKILFGFSALVMLAGMQTASAMGNPASINCVNKGGKSSLVGSVGYCTLPSGQKCEEWAFMRGECPAPNPKPMIIGGYTQAASSDVDVIAAGKFAAKALGKVYGHVNRAEKQVVAGMNYRLTITVKGGKQYQVVVYRNLSNRYKLVSSEKL